MKKEIQKIIFEGKDILFSTRDDADESVVSEIFKWREYKSAEDVIRKCEDTILDIGAHIGIFSLYAKALNPAAKVYALEPEKDNFVCLKNNIEKNIFACDVKIFNLALAKGSGARDLVIGDDNINHTLLHDRTEEVRLERVQAISFSDFLEKNSIERVGLLKMDIEGGEYEVIENLKKEDFNRINHVILEYHDRTDKNHKDIEKVFRLNGFSVQVFPSRFESDLGFMFARNKRIS